MVTASLSIARCGWRYAATGALAAQRFAPIAPARQAAVYVEDITRAADLLQLRPADAGAIVILAEPYDPVVFERTKVWDRLRVVCPRPVGRGLAHRPGSRAIGGKRAPGLDAR